MLYDYLIVGAGLFGATFARQVVDAGKTALVIDRRSHIAGNCFDEERAGILVHLYGPHLFHTSNQRVWDFVNRFAEFSGYHHTVMARTDNETVSLPINLATLNQLFDINTIAQAEQYFKQATNPLATGDNVEDWCLRTIGQYLYEKLIRDYTIKQWRRDPKTLPASIIKRLPIRLNWNNRYFSDRYEGLPIGGYTQMVARMLKDIPVSLNTDFDRSIPLAKKVIYSGSPDALYNYDLGRLAYRSIRIDIETLSVPDFQGIGQMNYTSMDVPWTRIAEPKHFSNTKVPHTIICKEYSVAEGEPYYPINDDPNTALAARYTHRAAAEGIVLGGRLGSYQYFDMHQAIAQALAMSERELCD